MKGPSSYSSHRINYVSSLHTPIPVVHGLGQVLLLQRLWENDAIIAS